MAPHCFPNLTPPVHSQQEEYDEEEGEGEEGESEEEQAEEDVGALSQQLAALMRANPALRTATAAEQRTYQRVFDKHGNPQEVLLAFAPNTATVRQGRKSVYRKREKREGRER